MNRNWKRKTLILYYPYRNETQFKIACRNFNVYTISASRVIGNKSILKCTFLHKQIIKANIKTSERFLCCKSWSIFHTDILTNRWNNFKLSFFKDGTKKARYLRGKRGRALKRTIRAGAHLWLYNPKKYYFFFSNS